MCRNRAIGFSPNNAATVALVDSIKGTAGLGFQGTFQGFASPSDLRTAISGSGGSMWGGSVFSPSFPFSVFRGLVLLGMDPLATEGALCARPLTPRSIDKSLAFLCTQELLFRTSMRTPL